MLCLFTSSCEKRQIKRKKKRKEKAIQRKGSTNLFCFVLLPNRMHHSTEVCSHSSLFQWILSFFRSAFNSPLYCMCSLERRYPINIIWTTEHINEWLCKWKFPWSTVSGSYSSFSYTRRRRQSNLAGMLKAKPWKKQVQEVHGSGQVREWERLGDHDRGAFSMTPSQMPSFFSSHPPASILACKEGQGVTRENPATCWDWACPSCPAQCFRY